MKGLKLFAATIGMVAIFVSCGKDKYQPKGNYGNADVVSTTGTLSGSLATFDDGNTYEIKASLVCPSLTQAALNDGMVMVYFYRDGAWVSIPYSTHGETYNESMYFEAYAGFVRVIVDGWDYYDSPAGNYLDGTYVKVAVISKAGLAANPGVDLTSYEQVAEAFDL